MITVAAVTAIPMKLNRAIVNGRPIAWPMNCDLWLCAKRVKSGMLRLSVAQ